MLNLNHKPAEGEKLKVNCYLDSTLTENHVDIHCREKDSKIDGIIRYINAYTFITGATDN